VAFLFFLFLLLESGTLADRHWRLIDSNQARTSSLLRSSGLAGLFIRFIYYYKLMLVCVCVCVYSIDDSFTSQLLYQQTGRSPLNYLSEYARVVGPTAFDYFMSSEKCRFERRIDDSFFSFSLFEETWLCSPLLFSSFLLFFPS
jgi:hypothetical protein